MIQVKKIVLLKRRLNLLLSVLMVIMLFLVCGVRVNASSTDLNGAKNVSIDSLEEKTQLKNLLTWLEFYLQYTTISNAEDEQGDHYYNYKKITSREENIFETLVRMPVLYKDYDQTYPNNEWSCYPGKGARLTSDFNYKSDKTKIDFIMTEILNCSQENFNSLRKDCIGKSDYWGGVCVSEVTEGTQKWYIGSQFGIGWELGWEDVHIKSAEFDGYYYYISYKPQWDFEEFASDYSSIYYATLGLKTIDGKKYWSIYANSPKGFISFPLPVSVTEPTSESKPISENKPNPDSKPISAFQDVYTSDYYANAVIWAVNKGITNGIDSSHFGPKLTVTRGQAVTFLWRLKGEPEPMGNYYPFVDVSSSDYFYKAVCWAVEQGITKGTSNTTFSPNNTLTRAHMITFLYRTAGQPGKTGNGEWYSDAENWGKNKGILGVTATNYRSEDSCPRSDVVYYLWKYL